MGIMNKESAAIYKHLHFDQIESAVSFDQSHKREARDFKGAGDGVHWRSANPRKPTWRWFVIHL